MADRSALIGQERRLPHAEQTEQEIQRELAKRVYDISTQLQAEAFAASGITPERLPDNTAWAISLRSRNTYPRFITVTIRRPESNDRRAVNVKETGPGGSEIFTYGRFVEPDGKMYQAADSSQGQPWYDADLPVSTLLEMVGRMELLAQADYDTKVELTAYHPANQAAAA